MKRTTTKDFIEKSKLKHLDRYDYSIVEYINSNTKVKIICKEHGIFEQYPLNHTKGSGCPSCKGLKKLSTKDFIEKSLKIHNSNSKYNYSLVRFENNDSKIDIICENHGLFQQRVSSHLSGNGCNKCKNDSRRNKDIFIEKSNIKHNYKYDYSLVNYQTTNQKVKIICKDHGIFEKTPKNHINGQGCKSCLKITTEKFIKISNLKHNNKYDYSLTKYKHSLKNVIIICPIHGVSEQLPTSHLRGNGCQECGKLGYNNDEYINIVNLKHNYKYNYDELVYKGSSEKINIICPIHGKFKQRSSDHIKGHGCSKCGDKYGIKENKWLDSFNVKQRQVRIGKYIVDGYDTLTNTIYEFNGDFWHGNPNVYNSLDINRVSKKTFGELYENTINKEKELISLGYNVISIWESEYRKKN